MTKKKKIGIVTYWESYDNYGQQLQCWALQRYLISMGHSPFLIRVRMFSLQSRKSWLKYSIKSILRWIKKIFANILIDLGGLQSAKISRILVAKLGKDWVYRRFEVFQRKFIKSTHIYNSYSELTQSPPAANVYIAGSDQIWNADLPYNIWKITFLQFGNSNIKRIAYAPSMSMSNMDVKQKELFAKYLQSFSALSAREEKTVKKCNEFGYSCDLVLDPSLLLSRKYYDAIAKSIHKNPYIFIYSINYETADEIPPIDELRIITNNPSCNVIVTTGGGYIKNDELLTVEAIYDYATIPEWLGNIRNAELIVTPSFHGIVFAIIFHRNFIFTPLQSRYAKGNDRVLDLLKHLEINGHIWGNENIVSPIDWKRVDDLLDDMKKRSSIYLHDAINI